MSNYSCHVQSSQGLQHIAQPRLKRFNTRLQLAASRPAAGTLQLPTPELLQVEQQHGLWHKGVHYVASEVRDYELDQFQVVNNAVYASYVQHGRHKAFQNLGLSVEAFQKAGTLMALSDLALQYKAPLRSGDVFFITTAVAQVTAARLILDHTVQLQSTQHGQDTPPQVICQGQATVVFLDQHYKPVRVPAVVKTVLAPLHQEYKAEQQQRS